MLALVKSETKIKKTHTIETVHGLIMTLHSFLKKRSRSWKSMLLHKEGVNLLMILNLMMKMRIVLRMG
jgi:hypothetical protein